MKKCMHKIENMLLQASTIYSCPGQMSQSAFFQYNILCSYILTGNCVCQKLGNGPGLANAGPWAVVNLEMPCSSPGDWAQVALTDAKHTEGWSQLQENLIVEFKTRKYSWKTN